MIEKDRGKWKRIVNTGSGAILGASLAFFPSNTDIREAGLAAVGNIGNSVEKIIERETALDNRTQTEEQEEAVGIVNHFLKTGDKFPFLEDITVGKNGARVTNLPVRSRLGVRLSRDVRSRMVELGKLQPGVKINVMRHYGTYPVMIGEKTNWFVFVIKHGKADGMDKAVEVGFISGDDLNIVARTRR